MMPKIAIVGANEAIDILIHKAKEKGYETHVFAWQCGDPGEKSADFFYPVSVAEKEMILDICRSIKISGICSITSDFAVNTVNYVARNLGLVCNSEKTDNTARDKYLMRREFKKAGLYTPWFKKVNNNMELSFMTQHEYPVIVKPTDRWSSKGVTRVDRFEDLSNAVEYAIKESLSGEAIIEDFMEGPEYSAECICQNGECSILAYTQKITTGYPHYVETGHMEPADISDIQKLNLERIINRAVKALDITDSAAHVEFRIIDNNEIGLIEIGARMGGDYIGTDLVHLTTGFDYVGMVIDVACGKRIEYKKFSHYSKAYVQFILNQNDFEKYTEIDSKTIIRKVIRDTGFLHEVLNSADRYGYYICAE